MINGGTFKNLAGTGKLWDPALSLTINGGTFHGQDPTPKVDGNHVVTTNEDGSYTVTPKQNP